MSLSRTNTPEARLELGLDLPRHRWRRAYHATKLVTAYWRSADWKIAWTLLALNIAIGFYSVDQAVSLTDWNRRLLDTATARNGAAIPGLMLELCWIIAALAIAPLFTEFLTYYLKMRWRLWLTRDYMGRWLANNRYQEIERLRIIDNPDQRITEDTRLIAEQVLALVTTVVNAGTQAVAFGIVLYGLSVPIRLAAGGIDVAIPGDMLIYAVLATAFGTWMIALIGRPLVRRTMRQQHLDADLRYGLGNIRHYAEEIAFLRAAPSEQRSLLQVIVNIRRNYMGYIFANLGLMAGQTVYMRALLVLPLFLVLPRYMDGSMTIGQYGQAIQVFGTVTASLSILVQVYPGIATQIAAINRLGTLDDALEAHRPARIVVDRTDDGTIRAVDLRIQLPDGRALLTLPQWRVGAGERWVVTGPSGSGKSTLLRALAGLWPDGHGCVALPDEGMVMFVPQKLYLPVGQLKDAVSFPMPAHDVDDAHVLELLGLCRLGHLADKLHIADAWQDRLSPGEQQRLALVRVLLFRPSHLLIDEATSALDEDNAAHFYRTLIATLPDTSIVSITHASALERFHDKALRIVDGAATTVHLDRGATL